MIYVGENKSTLYKGNFHPAELYKGDKKIAGYTMEEFEGTESVTLENCYNDKVYDIEISENAQSITVRGKNYFDLDKVPFLKTTEPYNNGLKFWKSIGNNRGDKIPISLPVGRTIYITMDVVDSMINGTAKRVTMGFFNSSGTLITSRTISSSIAHKSYSFAFSEEVSYMQFYFQANNEMNAVGDYVTMDNIMFRCVGDDTYEKYIEPQTILFENGEPTADIPTFIGTTVIEAEATISGKYKKMEE